MNSRTRILLAVGIGSASMIFTGFQLWRRECMACDFSHAWLAARYLLEGRDPYQAIQTTGVYPFISRFFYPLPVALVVLPLAFLPATLAGAIFFGISAGLLAYALSEEGWQRLMVFLSAPFWVALSLAQWSPLMLAVTFLPGLQWLLICKPNLGAALFIYRPSWRTVLVAGAVLLVSWLILPAWPGEWLEILGEQTNHPTPVGVILPGVLLLLAVLRWRDARGRLLLAMAVLPQTLWFYDQIPLWLIPRGWKTGLAFSLLSWAGYVGWRISTGGFKLERIPPSPDVFVVAFLYLPALVMVLWPKDDLQALRLRLKSERA